MSIERLLNQEDSMKLAQSIELLKIYLRLIDVEYADRIATEMFSIASHQDSISALSPRYNFKKGALLREQAKSLRLLSELIASLRNCDMMKKDIGENDEHAGRIDSLFI